MAVSALAAIVIPATAAALPQPSDAAIAEARAQFGEARKLEDSGDWSKALELLQRVADVKMTPQVRFHLALCMEHVGLLTQALDGFTHAASEADGTDPEVVDESREHIRALEKQTPTVAIAVSGSTRNDELLLDRRPIPIDDPPVPIRVDPGAHTAEVRRGRDVVARTTFVSDPETTKRIELHVDPAAVETPLPAPSASAPAATSAAPTASAAPPPPPTAPPPPPVEPTGNTQRAVGIAVLSVGGAAAVLTAVFAGLRAGAMSDLDASCPTEPRCPASKSDVVDGIVGRGKTYATLANVFGIAAAVSVVGGATLWLTAPSAAPPSARGVGVAIAPLVAPSHAGVGITGRF